MKHIVILFVLFLLVCTPANAVIQDRGSPEQPTSSTATNDDILTSLANLDKSLSGLNTKIPTLIESRFSYYESIQRQNDVKMLLGQLGAFLIALAIYAMIKSRNKRDKERALTRSEQLLTNIEKRLHKAESENEVNVVVVNTPKTKEMPKEEFLDEVELEEPIPEEPTEQKSQFILPPLPEEISPEVKDVLGALDDEPTLKAREELTLRPTESETLGLTKNKVIKSTEQRTLTPPPEPIEEPTSPSKYSMSIKEIFYKYRPNDTVPYDLILCENCFKDVKGDNISFDKVCETCKARLEKLKELFLNEDGIIKKQMKLGFCKKCKKEVKNGGLQRGFIPCEKCFGLLLKE